MRRLGKKIERALPKVKPAVEDLLNMDLGQIRVKPSPRRCSLKFIAHASNGGVIAYNPNPLINFMVFSDREAERITAHELAHIAHYQIVGYEETTRLPSYLIEGFADFVALETMRELYSKPPESIVLTSTSHSRQIYKFQLLLREQGVDPNFKDIVGFLKTQTC